MERSPTDPPSPGTSENPLALLTTSGTLKDNSLNSTSDLSVDESGMVKENAKSDEKSKSLIVTWDMYEPFRGDEDILFLDSIPTDMSYDIITQEFGVYGKIKKISLELVESLEYYHVWIFFATHKDALRAYDSCSTSGKFTCKLQKTAPSTGDVFYPSDTDKIPDHVSTTRTPLPATWLVATVTGDRGNLYNFRKMLRLRVGDISNDQIKRFGRNSFLIHAKSHAQGMMLSKLRIKPGDMLKDIKPHYNFSYAKGLIYN